MAGGFVDIDSGSLLTPALDAVDEFIAQQREREDKAKQDTAMADAMAAGAEMQDLLKKGGGNPREMVGKLANLMRMKQQENPHITPHLSRIMPGLGRTIVEQSRQGRPPSALEAITDEDVAMMSRGRPDVSSAPFPGADGGPAARARATAPLAAAEQARGMYDARRSVLRRDFANAQDALAEWQGGHSEAVNAAALLGYEAEKPEYEFITERGRVYATNARTGEAREVAYAPDDSDKDEDYPIVLRERDLSALGGMSAADARRHFHALAGSKPVKDMWEGEAVKDAVDEYNRTLKAAGLNSNVLEVMKNVRAAFGNDANLLNAIDWLKGRLQKAAGGRGFSLNAHEAEVEFKNNPAEGVLQGFVDSFLTFFKGSRAETSADAMELLIEAVENPVLAREAINARARAVRVLENHLGGNVSIQTPDGRARVSDPTLINSLADILIEEAPKLPKNGKRAAPSAPPPPKGSQAWGQEHL